MSSVAVRIAFSRQLAINMWGPSVDEVGQVFFKQFLGNIGDIISTTVTLAHQYLNVHVECGWHFDMMDSGTQVTIWPDSLLSETAAFERISDEIMHACEAAYQRTMAQREATTPDPLTKLTGYLN